MCWNRPRLVDVVVRCPCRRRISHRAVEEGQSPPQLACDRECEVQQRQNTLAAAFNVDPATYVPWTDRNRYNTRPTGRKKTCSTGKTFNVDPETYIPWPDQNRLDFPKWPKLNPDRPKIEIRTRTSPCYLSMLQFCCSAFCSSLNNPSRVCNWVGNIERCLANVVARQFLECGPFTSRLLMSWGH